MQDFSFSAEDLRANRDGKFSQGQRAALVKRRQSALILVGVAVLFFLALLLIAYRALQPHDGEGDFPALIEIVIFALGVMIAVRLRHMNIGRDLHSGTVVSVRGALMVSEGFSERRGRYYHADVGATHFAVPEATYVALSAFQEHEPGRLCVIYYTPITKTVLSFEAMKDAPPPRKTSLQEALARQHAEEEERYGK